MAGSNKKYKLFAAATSGSGGGAATGSKPPCAFFATEAGCRNGKNCKFSHGGDTIASSSAVDVEYAPPASAENKKKKKASSARVVAAESGSVVSSESSSSAGSGGGGGCDDEAETGGNHRTPRTIKPVGGGSAGGGKSEDRSSATANQEVKKSAKQRRGKRKADESIFANPKKIKTVGSSSSVSSSAKGTPRDTDDDAQKHSIPPVAEEQAPAAKPAPPKSSSKKKKKPKPPAHNNSHNNNNGKKPPSYLSLDLPIASFSMPTEEGTAKKKKKSADSDDDDSAKPTEDPDASTATTAAEAATPSVITTDNSAAASANNNSAVPTTPPVPPPPLLPLPKSTAAGKKWLLAVQNTQNDFRFKEWYDFDKLKEKDAELAGHGSGAWVKARPFGPWAADLPQVVAIDCEMCETEDPVSGKRDARALCRISVVDADKTGDVLLDTLVKPAWPVVNHRTWINGISAENLENVQFTIRHAQAFMMALCSEETVIAGQAVYNDLAAMRLEHRCVADSACLFAAKDSETAPVGLKDLAAAILKKDMPEKHDSVNDARTALACLEHYIEKKGKVARVERVAFSKGRAFASQLLVHRIPKKCSEDHLSAMFLSHTSVEPVEVGTIEQGKSTVHFRSPRHAILAFDTLEDKAEPDSSGRLQKKVFLRDGGYIRVRKMAYDKARSNGDDATKAVVRSQSIG